MKGYELEKHSDDIVRLGINVRIASRDVLLETLIKMLADGTELTDYIIEDADDETIVLDYMNEVLADSTSSGLENIFVFLREAPDKYQKVGKGIPLNMIAFKLRDLVRIVTSKQIGKVVRIGRSRLTCGCESSPFYIVRFEDGTTSQYWGEELELAEK